MTHYITITPSRMRQLWGRIGECSAVVKPGVNFRFIIVTFFLISGFSLIVIPEAGYCQPTQKTESQAHLVDGFLELKIPVGFKVEAVDEPHIFKWTKDSSEIYVVVGERLVGSVKNIINNLKKAAATNKLLDKTRTLRISNAKGILIKEKIPSDPDRLVSWGVKIFTEKHELNIDFSAPAKEFKTHAPAFEEVIKSIKIKSS
jgi:hypothetical protein